MENTHDALELPAFLDRRGDFNPKRKRRKGKEKKWWQKPIKLSAEERRWKAKRKAREAVDQGKIPVLNAVRDGHETVGQVARACGLDNKLVSKCLKRLVRSRKILKLSTRRYGSSHG